MRLCGRRSYMDCSHCLFRSFGDQQLEDKSCNRLRHSGDFARSFCIRFRLLPNSPLSPRVSPRATAPPAVEDEQPSPAFPPFYSIYTIKVVNKEANRFVMTSKYPLAGPLFFPST